jgi:hypothetical protein
MLEHASPKLASKQARRNAMALVDRRKGRKVRRLSGKGVNDLVKIVTGNLRDAPRRSAATPRSARK